ncbi:hypothetical protein HNR25_001946 [Streptomonospora salina]|uniref:Uncharacterized protein n=1 Tax=Streptomonospora salina TaxID=104205 RepID=A0A841E4Y2_9ACTN|nr:hypothetical protein [Streptomonospora salina]
MTTSRRPPRIDAATWDPVGLLAEYYRSVWEVRGVLVPGGDWHWRLSRRSPVPAGAAVFGVEAGWEGYASPAWIRGWLIGQDAAWKTWRDSGHAP